jgi:hypothetical protein
MTSNDNIINVDQNVNVGNPTLISEKIEKEQDQSQQTLMMNDEER